MNVVVSPTPLSIATGQVLQLDIFVDSTSWEGQFDSLEVWRSRLSDGGPYVALTGDGWAPASLPSLAAAPSPAQTGPSAYLVGKTLSLLVGEKTPITITFTGSDPTTFASAATQIAAQSGGLLSSFVLSGVLYVQTKQPGAGSSLRVVGGDTAPLLGLQTQEPGSLAFGVDARVPLVYGVSSYVYTDLNGSRDYFYKTRFFNTLSRTTSDFSIPYRGRSPAGVDLSNLIRATINVVDARGIAVAGTPVLLFDRFAGTQVSGKTVIGGNISGLTDDNGHFETPLLRGTQVTVAVGGTNIARDVSVPTDPAIQTFDLLDPAYGKDDVFNVQVPNLRYAVRRSL
jgi:hypothetical protein